MSKRNPNGAGGISLRRDGRYHERAYVTTSSGMRKRASVYGKTWEEVHTKVVAMQSDDLKGMPLPDAGSTLADYLAYWLAAEAAPNRRPKTYQGYESVVRVHLVPGLGRKRLRDLRGQEVRVWLNRLREQCQCCKHGWDEARRKPRCCAARQCCQQRLSPGMVQSVHAVLRNALEHAVREELIVRNIAKLVKVPSPSYRIGQGLTSSRARLVLKELQGTDVRPVRARAPAGHAPR